MSLMTSRPHANPKQFWIDVLHLQRSTPFGQGRPSNSPTGETLWDLQIFWVVLLWDLQNLVLELEILALSCSKVRELELLLPRGWSCCPPSDGNRMGNRRSHYWGVPENLTDTIPSNNQKKRTPNGEGWAIHQQDNVRTTVRDRPTNWKRVNDSLLPKVQLDFWSLVHVQLALKLWEENQKPTRSNSKSNLLSNPELSHAHLSPVADILKNPPFRWKNPQPRMLARPWRGWH